MPSDCQCSTHVEVVQRTRTKVIGSKEATRRIRKLEAEVEKLKEENTRLKRLEKVATKKELIDKIKKQLDRLA